jgi:3' terminal RNA ribose 2'-O-methyltransferase Hen1
MDVRLPVVACRGGEALVRRLFEPLGYAVEVHAILLDARFPEWGDSPYFDLRLRQSIQVNLLLRHLYVLIPVLDNDKHYWIDSDEIDKLLRSGEGWLRDHPAKEEITKRYLRNQRNLTREALGRLAEEEGDPDPDAREAESQEAEEIVEKPISLNQARLTAVFEALKASGGKRVLDLGCGEGRLLGMLLPFVGFEEIVGMDVSYFVLERARQRLRLDRMPERVANKLKLMHGSLVYRDARLAGFDAAAVVEVVEHLDVPRLAVFERVLFEFARPRNIVMTTPNREYNALFATLPEGRLRHKDHRFEWTRAEFEKWGEAVAAKHGYAFSRSDIGPVDEKLGGPTQMGVFGR